MDVGRYEGVAPSMSQKRQLDVEKKIWRQNNYENTALMGCPGENAARFRFPPTRARVGAKRSPRLVAITAPGRHNGEAQRGDKGEKERGERGEQKEKMSLL